MTIEVHVLRGARAGATERFDKSVIAIGRHPLSDLRFDPMADLDVSTRHAELRGVAGVWTLHDLDSTNGTYVNGDRITGSREVRHGDEIGFGANGPRANLQLLAETAMPKPMRGAEMPATVHATPAQSHPPVAPRLDTSVRVAQAVERHTASLRREFIAAIAVLAVAGAGAFALWQRQASRREDEFLKLIARIESSSAGLQRAIADMRPRDSAFATLLAEQGAASLRAVSDGRSAAARGTAPPGAIAQLSQRLERDAQMQRSLTGMNFARVHDLNDDAVAMIASDLEGSFIAGTAFGITRGGLLVTNRHVVQTAAGQPARRLRVIFAGTREWLPAHIVRVSEHDDLALVQLDVPGGYPVVAGVSRAGAGARVGAPVATIGYPHAVDTPMEGSGMHVTARSTTTAGTVSKRLADVLQIDAYAGKGSSGSPVFDVSGSVVGVIYGGAPASNGRIVYAVPAERLAAFLGADGSGVLR